MASTAETVTSWAAETSEPEHLPDRDALHAGSVEALLEALKTLGRRSDEADVIPLQPPGVVEPTNGPVTIRQDEVGQFIVQDILGAVYGAGATQEEATADFYTMLDSHLDYLRRNRDRLDPALLRQLAGLQRLFGR